MKNRRQFIAAAAGSLATVGAIGRVRAADGEELSKEDINSAALSGAQRNGSDGVEQALTDLGLDPTVKSAAISTADLTQPVDDADNQSGDSLVVSPDYVYGNPDSSSTRLIVSTVPVYGESNQVWRTTTMVLNDAKYAFRNSWFCPDAIGFGFISQDWAPVGVPNVSATDGHNAKFTAQDVAQDALAGTIELKNRTPASSPEGFLPDAIASLTGKFQLRDGGVASSLWGSYTHTFAPDPSGAITSISGGFRGLGVSVSLTAATAWSKALATDPSNSL